MMSAQTGPAGARHSKPPLARNRSTDDAETSQVAHTLTACTRCRQRKTRCDIGLPKCHLCRKTNASCEYWDPVKRCLVNRDYVVWLQHRVRNLEKELDELDPDGSDDDPELMIRGGAAVRLQDNEETKYLGPSSGTQLTRIVMQLAKHFTDAKSIKDIIPDAQARRLQEMTVIESAKPTSKVYPLVSSVPADGLPDKDLILALYQLFCLKVQPQYPAIHEPTLAEDINAAHAGTGDDFQNFVTRMVIAISLQKMDTMYAGLADSYYLSALTYMEAVSRKQDLRTLQAFALIAEYSLLTPTRTAIYFVVGLAIQLLQKLGLHEEVGITRKPGGGVADPLEVDLRRRLFWCIFTMEAGLAHALGRPMSLAIGREHFDVGFFELCDDSYITREGILPGARPILKKWVAMHFFKMRLLQLEIRRKLYLRKRDTPKDDEDPWFHDILARMDAWKDASPEGDGSHGLDKLWFTGRYNTMITFLHRPCPQIPQPSVNSAIKCMDAAKFNIYMTRAQIKNKNVDLTWIFTQMIFMAVNAMLWSLSYGQVRLMNPRSEVEQHLLVGLEVILVAADRWPGVASAHALYVHIIAAILKAYDKEGDIHLPSASPEGPAASPIMRLNPSLSRQSSAGNSSASLLASPPPRSSANPGYLHYQTTASSRDSPYSRPDTVSSPSSTRSASRPLEMPQTYETAMKSEVYPPDVSSMSPPESTQPHPASFRPLPNDFMTFVQDGWPVSDVPHSSSYGPYDPYLMPTASPYHETTASTYSSPYLMPSHSGYSASISPLQEPLEQQAETYLDVNSWATVANNQAAGFLSSDQQNELMQNLETTGWGDIQMMIAGANRLFNPQLAHAK